MIGGGVAYAQSPQSQAFKNVNQASSCLATRIQRYKTNCSMLSYFQVQDVGLIFLSAMATSIVHEGLGKKTAEADILGTTLLTLTASTFIVGLLIIIVGEPAACQQSIAGLM